MLPSVVVLTISLALPTNWAALPSMVFVRDVVAGQTFLASRNHAGTRTGNGFSFAPLMSADGRRLVFLNRASDLITNDLNNFAEDIFVFTLIDDAAPVLHTEENSDSAIALDSG